MGSPRVRNAPPPSLTGLLDVERGWKDRQLFLLSKGYQLRPRLRHGWKPSWEGTDKNILDCEDAVVLPVSLHALETQSTQPSCVRRDYIWSTLSGALTTSSSISNE